MITGLFLSPVKKGIYIISTAGNRCNSVVVDIKNMDANELISKSDKNKNSKKE